MTQHKTAQRMALGLLVAGASALVAQPARAVDHGISGSLSGNNVGDGSDKTPPIIVANRKYADIAKNCNKATDLGTNAAIGAASLKAPAELSVQQYCDILWKPIQDSASPACKDLIGRYSEGIAKFQGTVCGAGGALTGVKISNVGGMTRVDFLLSKGIEFKAKLPGKGSREYNYKPESGMLSFLVGSDPATAKSALSTLVDLQDKKAAFVFARSNYKTVSDPVRNFVDELNSADDLDKVATAITIRRGAGLPGQFLVKEDAPKFIKFNSSTYFQSKTNPGRNMSVGKAGEGDESGAKAFALPSFSQ
ncbi:MAG: hypothetical protein JST16_11400 [Bdellovibrionales bacterium]|nr:hypothetical protein [Bdellovibrionales bacterium]